MCTRTIILLESSLSTITIAMSAVHQTQSLCYLVKLVSTPERDVNIQSSHRRGGERNSKSVSRGKDVREKGLSVIQRCPNSWVKGRESSLPSIRPTEKTSLSERTWAWRWYRDTANSTLRRKKIRNVFRFTPVTCFRVKRKINVLKL